MIGILHSEQLSELVFARLAETPADDVAGIVLGPRLRDLCAALGVPVRDWWQVSLWTARHHDSRALDAFGSYVDVLVADRCRRPGNDLISDLIAFEVDGEGLTADEIRPIVTDLLSS